MDAYLIEIATRVIIYAGNARSLVHEALLAAGQNRPQAARDLLDQAEGEISQAHQVQTGLIQAEARGEPVAFSLLLSHAQDTLMSAISELNMARHMLVLFEQLLPHPAEPC